MTDRKFTGINKVTVNSVDETNVLDVDIWLMTDDYNEDLVEVQFTPGTIEGVGFKQWAKCWLVKIVHDGWTDLWDSYIDDDGEGIALPNFSVTFDIVEDVAEKVTEVWTFQANKSYIANRDEIRVEIEQERTPGAIYVVCIGTVEITHV